MIQTFQLLHDNFLLDSQHDYSLIITITKLKAAMPVNFNLWASTPPRHCSQLQPLYRTKIPLLSNEVMLSEALKRYYCTWCNESLLSKIHMALTAPTRRRASASFKSDDNIQIPFTLYYSILSITGCATSSPIPC